MLVQSKMSRYSQRGASTTNIIFFLDLHKERHEAAGGLWPFEDIPTIKMVVLYIDIPIQSAR